MLIVIWFLKLDFMKKQYHQGNFLKCQPWVWSLIPKKIYIYIYILKKKIIEFEFWPPLPELSRLGRWDLKFLIKLVFRCNFLSNFDFLVLNLLFEKTMKVRQIGTNYEKPSKLGWPNLIWSKVGKSCQSQQNYLIFGTCKMFKRSNYLQVMLKEILFYFIFWVYIKVNYCYLSCILGL